MRIAIKGPELTDVHFEEISDSRTDKFNCNLVTVCSSAINILILLGGGGEESQGPPLCIKPLQYIISICKVLIWEMMF